MSVFSELVESKHKILWLYWINRPILFKTVLSSTLDDFIESFPCSLETFEPVQLLFKTMLNSSLVPFRLCWFNQIFLLCWIHPLYLSDFVDSINFFLLCWIHSLYLLNFVYFVPWTFYTLSNSIPCTFSTLYTFCWWLWRIRPLYL